MYVLHWDAPRQRHPNANTTQDDKDKADDVAARTGACCTRAQSAAAAACTGSIRHRAPKYVWTSGVRVAWDPRRPPLEKGLKNKPKVLHIR